MSSIFWKQPGCSDQQMTGRETKRCWKAHVRIRNCCNCIRGADVKIEVRLLVLKYVWHDVAYVLISIWYLCIHCCCQMLSTYLNLCSCFGCPGFGICKCSIMHTGFEHWLDSQVLDSWSTDPRLKRCGTVPLILCRRDSVPHPDSEHESWEIQEFGARDGRL